MSLEKLLTSFIIPVNIGILAILYVFAFTLYSNLLRDLHDFVDDRGTQKDAIESDPGYHKVEGAFKTGRIVMHLTFLWCLFSLSDGIIGIKILSLEAERHLGWLTCMRASWGLLWLISFILVAKNFKRRDYGPLFAIIVVLPSFLIALRLMFAVDCINSLFNAFLWMLSGLMYYCATWIATILWHRPLVSLESLRKRFPT